MIGLVYIMWWQAWSSSSWYINICHGTQAETVIENLHHSQDQLANYEYVTKALTKYFLPKINIIFEQAKFNQRFQQMG